MKSVQEPVNLLNFDRQNLVSYFAGIGEKPFRAVQVLKWIHQAGVTDFSLMSNLSKSLRQYLEENCAISAPEVVFDTTASDGTRKWLLEMSCGNKVETVFIPESGRGTLCVSSQIGCSLACTFCSTAQQGFNRNLSVAEIIGQLFVAQQLLGKQQKISNIVMMGMGEPLLNFNNVVAAMNLMMDDFAYGLSKRRVTLSTSGVVPAMYRLTEACDVSLAVSLHAATDDLRNQLVPINKKYPLSDLLDACRHYVKSAPRRHITFEYVMLAGINDSESDARALVRLLKKISCKINLIPFNSFPGSDYQCTSKNDVQIFRDILHRSGLVVTVRKTRGEDIDAACGQLVGKVADKSRRTQKIKLMKAEHAA
jgi:23S rRNA (adenine2503-C2)-methyltransferase